MGCGGACSCGPAKGPQLIFDEIASAYSAAHTDPKWEALLGSATESLTFEIRATDIKQDFPAGPMLYVLLQASADGVNWIDTVNLVANSLGGGSPTWRVQVAQSDLRPGLLHRLYVYTGTMGTHLARIRIWANAIQAAQPHMPAPLPAPAETPPLALRAPAPVERACVFDEMLVIPSGDTLTTKPEWNEVLGYCDGLALEVEVDSLFSNPTPRLLVELHSSGDGGQTWSNTTTFIDQPLTVTVGREVVWGNKTPLNDMLGRLKVTIYGTDSYAGRVRVYATPMRKNAVREPTAVERLEARLAALEAREATFNAGLVKLLQGRLGGEVEQPGDVRATPAQTDIGLGPIQTACSYRPPPYPGPTCVDCLQNVGTMTSGLATWCNCIKKGNAKNGANCYAQAAKDVQAAYNGCRSVWPTCSDKCTEDFNVCRLQAAEDPEKLKKCQADKDVCLQTKQTSPNNNQTGGAGDSGSAH